VRLFCLLLIGFLPFRAFSKSSVDCQELKLEQIRLALTASNLGNVHSTRTPEGGPYRPYAIKSCSNGGCDVIRDNRPPLMKYLPDHPDADKNGYVAYPNIDRKSEYAIFNMTAMKLKLLASNKACDSTVLIDSGDSSFILQYNGKGAPNVKDDTFDLTSDRQVVSWMRQDTRGKATTVNFDSSGEVTSHSENE
jgi:flagellar basal-body rod protein FlgC